MDLIFNGNCFQQNLVLTLLDSVLPFNKRTGRAPRLNVCQELAKIKWIFEQRSIPMNKKVSDQITQ